MKAKHNLCSVKVATYQRAKEGNSCCGDRYIFKEIDTGYICAIADGLGSGKRAKDSADAVINVIRENHDNSSRDIINKCNDALVHRRGVVLGILRINIFTNTYSFLSIGNIGLIVKEAKGKRRRMIPKPGYLAGYFREFKEEIGELENGLNFLMFSDGVLERELSEAYMMGEDVNDIIKVYIELNGKERKDDTTLIALRYDRLNKQL